MSVDTPEIKRIAALKRYEILDTPQDGTFNRLTELASKIFNVPISIISLVDTDRIWFKSRYGLEVDEIQQEPGLCTSAILSDDVYVVENAREDPRTLTNSLVVSDFGLQFYAAAPLRTSDGFNLGTLCIIDRKQRFLNESQKEMLKELASIVMDELEIRLAARVNAKKTYDLLQSTLSHLKQTNSKLQSLPDVVRTEELDSIIAGNDQLSRQLDNFLKQ
ncbi:GAF domain-containing protein [Pontibacter sp. KCTC 32443]|uniref:GAF domain-containing protein n=1 Tax=Pontibacter TaxID=323449 RepID=UPI00164D2434|nr:MULTISPECIES: GAF domain-containing protein [Pontibacter]MBC5775259.1 GAF domain-containing protein [Pontibacter sp. KCTC 32443]